MNQILDYDMGKTNKAPKGNGGGGSASDKIVKILAILLMALAICLIGSGVYSLVKNKKDVENNSKQETPKVSANIEATEDAENGVILLNITSEIEINKVIYNWNQRTEKEISGNDSKTMEESIDLPSGKNTLNVKVIDSKNNETSKSFTFESDTGVDLIKPNIELKVTEDKKLLITATDETKIAYITYKWNEDEQVTVEATEENDKEITVELEIPKGKNSITVIAVDASEKTNTNSQTKSLNGVTKPNIEYGLTADGSTLEIKCTHENGIKEIYYTLNDRPYQAVYSEEDGYPTEVSFAQPLDEGYNRIILKVTSVDDTVSDFDGECEYSPSGAATSQTDSSSNNTTEETE